MLRKHYQNESNDKSMNNILCSSGLYLVVQCWFHICKSVSITHKINRFKRKKNHMIMSLDAERFSQNPMSIPDEN